MGWQLHQHAPGGLKHGTRELGVLLGTSEFPLVPPSLKLFLCVLDKHSLAQDSVFSVVSLLRTSSRTSQTSQLQLASGTPPNPSGEKSANFSVV